MLKNNLHQKLENIQIMIRSCIVLFLGAVMIISCNNASQPDSSENEVTEVNPAAEGFNAAASDAKAIEIADAVMEAMGGRKNWDETRFISWNFFGYRQLTWDKQTGNVRIQASDSTIYQINIFTDQGQIMKDGQLFTEKDSIAKYVNRGKGIWINDSYWLVMPFKLKDSGVTLKHAGTDTISGGETADVLELTFNKVGNTPNNKYLVYVDKEDNLVKQWDFYRNVEDEQARISTPWNDYKQHGKILLSGGRGNRNLTDIQVFDSLPDSTFTTFNYH